MAMMASSSPIVQSPIPSPSTTATPTSQFKGIRPKKPIDVWSTREKLCLASAVYKIGDQNWVSVSRAIKPYAEPNRSPDWFHQKNCVLQYYDMLEQLENPKRKRGALSETDTPSLQIMRKMTIERSEQLKKEVMEMQQEFKRLKSEAEAIDGGEWDDRLEDEWEAIQEEELLAEDDIKVEVTDTDVSSMSKDPGDSILGMSEADEMTQDSIADDDNTSISTVEVSSATASSLDISKLPASSHLLSSLLQSNVKTTNELQQLKIEQESTHVQPPVSDTPSTTTQQLSSSQNLQSLSSSQDPTQSVSSTSTPTNSTPTLNTGVTSTPIKSSVDDTSLVEGVGEVEEDHLVDVMTDVVEETIVESTDTATIVSEQVVIEESCVVEKPDDGDEDSNSPIVEGVEEEAREMEDDVADIKLEAGDDTSMDVETKDSAAELDVEGLEDVKEEVDKDSQEEDEREVKPLSEAAINDTEIELTETALKIEPLSPSSSISSRISETGSKRGRRAKVKNVRRLTGRKSYTDDERKEEVSSLPFSDPELSEEDGRDTDDILSGGLGASATGSILSESFPNSPASLSICSDTEEEKSYKQWKKSIMLVWRAASTHKYANVFLHPVTDDIAPGYKTVVLRPMDLGTIKKNVETGALRTTVEFQRDLMLMFSNAIMYNSSDHNVNRMATEMYDDVMQHIEIMVQTTDAKTVRQSRRPDTSDKEDDTKKRRLSVDQSESGKTKKRKTRTDEIP